MKNPLVSVILPVYNGERFLEEAIRSVLKQSYQPLEIILIDDGSTDATGRIAAGFAEQVRYFSQPNAGPAAARNLGIRMAKGEYIAFIDADDLWPDEKLHQQMKCLIAFPSIDILQGLIGKITLPNLVKNRFKGADFNFLFIYTNLGSMVMRRSVFKKIGDFEESLLFHEDTDFWLRAREAGVNILVQRKLALIYRIHGYNLTTGKDMKATGFLNILRRSIIRRRKSSAIVNNLENIKFIPELLEADQQKHRKKNQEPNSWPLVSIVLYSWGDYSNISKTLNSIQSQDYHPIELLFVGSSTNKIRELIEATYHQVNFCDCVPNDLASCLNATIKRSKGEMIAFLDSDGIWAPGKLKTQVSYLLEHPRDGFVVGWTRQIILPDLKYPSELIDGFTLQKCMGDLLGTMLVRRSTFALVGEFSVGFPGMEETDWRLRASDKGIQKKILPDVFLFRFIQPNSQFVRIEQMKAALLESVRSSVHRKRNVF